MTKTAEEYGRRPIPADKWVRSTLENALFDARESLVAAEFEKARARVAAAKADEMHLLWQSRISHLEAAMAALDAIPESAPAVRPWAFPAFLGDGLVSKGRGDGGTDGMPQSFSMSMTGVTVEVADRPAEPLPGVAGALADRPELATPLNTQPLRDPPYCDACNRPRGPGHKCVAMVIDEIIETDRKRDAADKAIDAALDRSSALPRPRPDRTTGEDSQEL
jgi:hypothetical protein